MPGDAATLASLTADGADRLVQFVCLVEVLAAATLAAAGVWIVAVPVLGARLLVRFGNSAPQTVGIDLVVGAVVVASLCAWGLLAFLERQTSRARTIWTGVAGAVLLVSLSLPLTAGIATSTKATLALMHVAAAAVLIPALRRSSTGEARRARV